MKSTLLTALLFLFLQTIQSQTNLRRVAYIVGNAVYDEGSTLYNPVNDARDLAKTLRDLGFEVSKFENVKRLDFQRIISRYGAELKKNPLSTVGLFYYSGHGMQINGRNFLMPTDADVEDEEDVETHCINLDLLMSTLYDAGNLMNIVVLDACRDNPFDFGIEIIAQEGDDAKRRKGLAAMDAPVGTFIAFATSPGNTANDGDGLNGLYTQELIKAIQIPDLTIEKVFKKVRTQVKELSDGEQIPWENSSLESEFYFKRSGARVTPKGKIITAMNENLPLPERYARDVCGCMSGLVTLSEKIVKMPANIAAEKRQRLETEEEETEEQSEKCLKNITKDYIEQITPQDERKAMGILQEICPKVYKFMQSKK